jgi:curved DNA-binding protein CbpA
MINDYYRVLKINRNASKNEIKKAFRKLALELHPDKNKHPNANQMFIELNEAYLILTDNEAKVKYDKEYDFWKAGKSKENSEEDVFNFNDIDLNKWAKNARYQGKEFSKMPFDEFAELVKEIIIDLAVVGSKAYAFSFMSIFRIFSFFTILTGIVSSQVLIVFIGIFFGLLSYLFSRFLKGMDSNHRDNK